MTLPKPEELKVCNEVQSSRKRAPIVVTLCNPDRLIDSSDVHLYKKRSSIAVTANGALRSRLRKLVLARNLSGIAVTTSACRNNFATVGSFTRASLSGVRSVSPNARRAARDSCFCVCVNVGARFRCMHPYPR